MKRRASLVGRMLGGGRYELLELIGKGAFAEVFRGRQIALEREVAVKILNENATEDEALVKRFHQEAATVARFDHPNIIKIFDHGQEEDVHYYVMNLLPRTLRSLLRPEQRLPVEIILKIARQLASALDYASATVKNFVHRDLKPENVMLDATHNAILSDFGLVRGDQISRLTIGNTILGTPAYMSPEQIRGLSLDPRSDLYSLGVLLYECAAGRPPFTGEIMSICHHHVHSEPPAPTLFSPDLPEAVNAMIMRLLEKDPNKRPQSPGDFLAALAELPLELRRHKTSIYSQPTIPLTRAADLELSGLQPTPRAEKPAHQLPAPEKPITPAPARRGALWPAITFVAVSAAACAIAIFQHLNAPEPVAQLMDAQDTTVVAYSNVAVPGLPPAQFGSLEIKSQPPGASILLNEIMQSEKTPARFDNLTPGHYEVQLHLPNHQTWRGAIEVTSDAVAAIMETLVAARAPEVKTAPLTITSEPPCEIFVNSRSHGTPTDGRLKLDLPVGRQTVEFRLKPHRPAKREVLIKAGTENKLAFKWFGTVRVLAFNEHGDPEYGVVYLDSANTGYLSDGAEREVPVGEYHVLVKKDGYVMQEEPPKIVVRGGERPQVVTIKLRKRGL